MSRVIVVALLLFSTSCGKVAQPRPPFIRIPEPVRDLTSSQTGYDVILSWTNPPRYIDGSNATDLDKVIVESDGKDIATVPVVGAGKPQSFPVDSRSWIGASRTFSVRVQTVRAKLSERSNVTRATPVDVPAGVTNLQGKVDQHILTLSWQPAVSADGYLVSRVDPPEPASATTDLSFKDTSYEEGKTYTYVVTAARRNGNGWIAGSQPVNLTITASDLTAPKTPAALQIVVPDKGAFVSWEPNDETDLAGYHLFRNGVRLGSALLTSNSFFDPDYAKGSSYSVSAVDEYGNESAPSAPVPHL